jgi:hypothetical protein
LGFRDESFDVKLPEYHRDDGNFESGGENSLFAADVVRYSNHRFQLDKFVSDIKTHLYHLPVESAQFPSPLDPNAHQIRIQDTLKQWWKAVTTSDFGFMGPDVVQLYRWRLKLQIKYHTTMILLFQPSQVVRNPTTHSLQIVFDSACAILRDYQALHECQGLHHGWRTVQNIFAAGVALIYSFWMSENVRHNTRHTELSKYLRSCSGLLSIGGEWWPSVRTSLPSFGSIVDLTIQKLYTRGSAAKQPRLAPTNDGYSSRQRAGGSSGVPPMVQDTPVASWEVPRAAHSDAQQESTAEWGMAEESSADFSLLGPATAQEHTDPSSQGLMGPEYAPQIKQFLADFGRSEFGCAFPLNDIGEQLDIESFLSHGR